MQCPSTTPHGTGHAQDRLRPTYHWVEADAACHRFLAPISDALGLRDISVWIDAGTSREDLDRLRCEGLVTAMGTMDGRRVAVVWSDFRVGGAAFGSANSERFSAFLRQLGRIDEGGTPLFYYVNSYGVSLPEGRKTFSTAFRTWPELLRHSRSALVVTCAGGSCLGLAPILFGLGHYRMAIGDITRINLTGPTVLKMFFGPGVDFEGRASAERVLDRTDLVHEMVPGVAEAADRFRCLLGSDTADRRVSTAGDPEIRALLSYALDREPQELVPGWCPELRLYLGERRGRRLGLFVNPPGRANNMITVRALDKFAAGLDIFQALGVPVISFLDSPGLDPRFDQGDANNIRRILSVGNRIIDYPWRSMGVVTGRCFGGAATLGFPKIFGGARQVAFRGSRIGAMHEDIVTQVLSGSRRLLEQWRDQVARQGPDMTDLITEGTIDAVIDPWSLGREIDLFLGEPVPEKDGMALPVSILMGPIPTGSAWQSAGRVAS